jgi:hypothetical protein
MAASPVSIRSAHLKRLPKIATARSLDGQTRNPSLGLAPGTELSFAGTRRLRVNWKKVGQFVVKCLADAARDSGIIWFWP